VKLVLCDDGVKSEDKLFLSQALDKNGVVIDSLSDHIFSHDPITLDQFAPHVELSDDRIIIFTSGTTVCNVYCVMCFVPFYIRLVTLPPPPPPPPPPPLLPCLFVRINIIF
jgi:hypothetical protein